MQSSLNMCPVGVNTPPMEQCTPTRIHVEDLEKSVAFYRDMLDLTVSENDAATGVVSMSSHPGGGHHAVRISDDSMARGATPFQPIEFRCETLAEVIGYWKRFVERGANVFCTVTHGSTVSCYLKDPDGNMLEVYWSTGLKARRGLVIGLDLNKSEKDVIQDVRNIVAALG